ncbi:MAG: hypothetical protein EOM90_01185 [Alphaproteobacteria bacterium]|nr:hypothetical protein [Alphaproteobacteria bacterium]
MSTPEHPTDDFFREMLSDHRIVPSVEAKKAFLSEAAKIAVKRSGRRKGYLLILSGLILVSGGLLFWIFTGTGSDQEFAILSKKETVIPTTIISTPILPDEFSHVSQAFNERTRKIQTEPFSLSGEPFEQSTTEQTSITPAIHNYNPDSTIHLHSSEKQQYYDSVPVKETPVNPGLTAPIVNLPPVAPGKQHSGSEDPGSKKNENPAKNKFSDPSQEKNTTDTLDKKGTRESYSERRIQIKFGVSYVPELMFNTLEGEKFVNTAGIEAVLKSGPFSLRTGVGISVSKGTNELSVAYNDWLGSYNRLDSILFTWNDPVKKYIPTIYLSRQEVWDSLMKLEYPRVIKRYYYLQIPLILGFDFWQNDRVTLGIRGGPILSVLLSSKELSDAYNPESKKIISVNGIPPEQVDLNWQVMAGFNTSIRLGRKFSLEVEPNIRYYFNSVFEKPSTSWKPWSVGLRLSFLVGY